MVSPSSLALALLVVMTACGSHGGESALDASVVSDGGLEDQVEVLELFDVSAWNTELQADMPTADLAFYLSEGGPLAWEDLAGNIERARRIFATVGVQLRVRSAIQLRLPLDWQELEPAIIDEPITPPELRDSDLYRHLEGISSRPTARTTAILEAIVAHMPDDEWNISAADTVHLISLRQVPIPFYEWDGSQWVYDSVPTGGLSLPPYIYEDRMPAKIRGAITLSFEVERFNPETRTLAHELGHKLINVSHEGSSVCPSFEANGPELMLYGEGEEIPSGESGRYHQERLLLSPFLYRVRDGGAVFDNRFQGQGSYRDPLYGSLYIDPPCSLARGSSH